MATATEIIKLSMQEIAVLGVGKTPKTGDLDDNLIKLNDMLDEYNTNSLMVPYRTQIDHVLNGSRSYTIGSGGDINTTRPVYILSAFSTRNEVDYPVYIARAKDEYDRIVKKGITGIPRLVYYEPTVPLGTLYVYYTGDASDTLHLNVRGQLSAFPDTTTDMDLAPGYKKLIYSNLAIEIAPSYEVTASAETVKKAKESMASIKRLNRQSPVMRFDDGIPRGRHYYNIESDS